ncbi:hypothetical protein ABEQ58_12320, partial [Cutibacterium acnes]
MVFKRTLNSLTLPQKCAIIALPLLLAFGFLFQQMYTQINTLISSSENELRGAVFLEKINPVMQRVLADRAQKQAGAVGDLSAALKAAKTELPKSWPITARNLEQVTALLPQALNKDTTDAQSEELGNQMVTLVRQLA